MTFEAIETKSGNVLSDAQYRRIASIVDIMFSRGAFSVLHGSVTLHFNDGNLRLIEKTTVDKI